jgi:hypothetical protein
MFKWGFGGVFGCLNGVLDVVGMTQVGKKTTIPVELGMLNGDFLCLHFGV